MEKKSSLSNIRHPTTALKSAISILEQFAKIKESKPLAHVSELAVEEGKLITTDSTLLKRVICFMGALFSYKAREKLKHQKIQVQKTVQGAIDTIKRNHLIIDNLHAGTSEEKQLASSTLEVIKLYNSSLKKQGKSSQHNWFQRFLNIHQEPEINKKIADHPIELPKPIITPSKNNVEASSNPTSFTHNPLNTQEADIIRMKANTLLRQHGIKFNSPADAFSTVKCAPIQTSLNSQSQLSTLCLTLDVLPGTTIRVLGSFKRDPKAWSAPISDSFKLSISSMHNGYPYPSQYTGWALADSLIPIYPHRLDQMPLFKPLYEKKARASSGLQPNGQLLNQAKQLLQLRQEAAAVYEQPLLLLHKQLFNSLISSAENENDEAHLIIESYFECLSVGETPLKKLNETFETINALFLINPHTSLLRSWSERTNPILFSTESYDVLECARSILKSEMQAALLFKHPVKEISDFIQLIGNTIGQAAQNIILQHWSEALTCTPPMLNDFEQKIQAAAFNQLQDFLEELNWDLENTSRFSCEFIGERLQQQIKADIALFEALSFEHLDTTSTELVYELEDYFNSRHAQV